MCSHLLDLPHIHNIRSQFSDMCLKLDNVRTLFHQTPLRPDAFLELAAYLYFYYYYVLLMSIYKIYCVHGDHHLFTHTTVFPSQSGMFTVQFNTPSAC